MTRLNNDILYLVAEKMLMFNEARTLSTSHVSNFMFLNRITKKAFLAQFSKMQQINVFNSPNIHEHNEDLKFTLYRNSDIDDFQYNTDCCGQYFIDNAFMQFLIQNACLNPKKIQASSVFLLSLWKQRLDEGDYTIPETSYENALALMCLNPSSAPIHYKKHFQNLAYVDIIETEFIPVHFPTIFAINPEEVSLNLTLDGWHCNRYNLGNAIVYAEGVKKVFFIFNTNWFDNDDVGKKTTSREFPADNWVDLILFVLRSCPSLSVFSIVVNINRTDDENSEKLASLLRDAIDSFTERVMPNVYRNVSLELDKKLRMSVYIQACLISYSFVEFPRQMFEDFGVLATMSTSEYARCGVFDRETLCVQKRLRDPPPLLVSDNYLSLNTCDIIPPSDDQRRKAAGCEIGFVITQADDNNSEFMDEMLNDMAADWHNDYLNESDDYEGNDDNDDYGE